MTEFGTAAYYREQYIRARDRAGSVEVELFTAQRKLAEINALHHPVTDTLYPENEHRWCPSDGQTWPCATHRILAEESE